MRARPRARAARAPTPIWTPTSTGAGAISGDRCGGIDPGMLCGFGDARRARTVAYAAQCGTATRPAGYRTAARLIRLAGPARHPGADPGGHPGRRQRRGGGAAGRGRRHRRRCSRAVAAARTPVTTLLIGEGGSGGALALAAPDNTWATPDSYFSVIAPELAAAILKRPPEEVRATADQLRLRPQDLVELGVVRGIVEAVEVPLVAGPFRGTKAPPPGPRGRRRRPRPVRSARCLRTPTARMISCVTEPPRSSLAEARSDTYSASPGTVTVPFQDGLPCHESSAKPSVRHVFPSSYETSSLPPPILPGVRRALHVLGADPDRQPASAPHVAREVGVHVEAEVEQRQERPPVARVWPPT